MAKIIYVQNIIKNDSLKFIDSNFSNMYIIVVKFFELKEMLQSNYNYVTKYRNIYFFQNKIMVLQIFQLHLDNQNLLEEI